MWNDKILNNILDNCNWQIIKKKKNSEKLRLILGIL